MHEAETVQGFALWRQGVPAGFPLPPASSFGLAIMPKALLRTDTDNSALLNTTGTIQSFYPINTKQPKNPLSSNPHKMNAYNLPSFF